MAVVSSAVAFGLAMTRAENRLAEATALAKAAAGKAAAARREFTDADTRSALMRQPRQRMTEAVPLVVIWDEVTKMLPAATWINDLRLEDSGVQIDGQSPNASELLAALSRSSVFTGAAFVSPVTRDPQRGIERFQIRMQVSRGK
jgi:general secretion pathway protein L